MKYKVGEKQYMNIEEIIKDNVTNYISETIDKEIENKVEDFRKELTYRKDKYISEVMKGIRMYSEIDSLTNGMNYKIIFENVYKIEGDK